MRESFAKVIGLDLAKLKMEDVELLAENLERFLYEELEKRGLTIFDVHIGIDVRVLDVLLVTVDLTVNSPVALGPEILARFDEAIDTALARFEKYLFLSSHSGEGKVSGSPEAPS